MSHLTSHVCIAYSNARDPGLWSDRGPDGHAGDVRVPLRLASSSGEFNLRAAIADAGLLLLPSCYVHDALRDNLWVRVMGEYVWSKLTAYAVYPPTRHLSSRVRAFIDSMVERLAGEPDWDRLD